MKKTLSSKNCNQFPTLSIFLDLSSKVFSQNLQNLIIQHFQISISRYFSVSDKKQI